MREGIEEGRKWFAIGAMLVLQICLCWLSLSEVMAMSIFCTGPRLPSLAWFGYIHFVFAGIFLLGLASLPWPRIRMPYIVLLLLTLPALPLQIWLVGQGYLGCDAL